MDLRKLKTLIDLVQASGISEIEITEEGDHVKIVNRPAAAAAAPRAPEPVVYAAPAPAAPAAQPAAPAPAVTANTPSGTQVTSPMVGTFYRAPSPAPTPLSKSALKSKRATLCASSKR